MKSEEKKHWICYRHLYVLYNNYIYNVYKDGKYRLEGGIGTDMNIKYRLLCKRLIEERKRVGVIQYYNVLFIMELLSDRHMVFRTVDERYK